ncbi:MAG: putative metal-binding motif-containing protein, partial [Myxococcota bacterium]|nr:putative metal-binding motif-containing protein [Myxococcota bacterium]
YCDGHDDNCDGIIDEDSALDAQDWYLDGDSDGFGDVGITLHQCAQPSGYVANADDCNDSDHLISPDAVETCDGTDNNCSGDESDAIDIVTWYADADNDGYGDETDPGTLACSQPSATIDNSDDCNDFDELTSPASTDVCGDGIDNNCSGDELDATDISTWYADSDGDTYGDINTITQSCTQPSGYVTNS